MIGAHVGSNKRTWLTFVCALALMCTWLVAQAPPAAAACGSGSFAGGTGTTNDPYLVSTAAQLVAVGDCNGSGNFKQTTDITLTSPWTPIRNSTTGMFSGTYDGAGYSVSGLSVSGSSRPTGMFEALGSPGMVKNMRLIAPQVTSTSTDVGAVAGLLRNGGVIFNVQVVGGSVTGPSIVGGVVGTIGTAQPGAESGQVKYSSATATVTATNGTAGGLAGQTFPLGEIKFSFSGGSVTASTASGNVGGLVGWGYGLIANSYTYAQLTKPKGAGVASGLSGYSVQSLPPTTSYSRATFNLTGGGTQTCTGGTVALVEEFYPTCNKALGGSTFWDQQISGVSTSAWGVGKTTNQMKTASTFSDAGWSPVIWNLVDGQYPTLKGALGFDPGEAAYGSRTVNVAATGINVTLTNNSGDTATLSSQGLSGANANNFSATVPSQCNSLASGASCTISTGFTPTSLGYKSATLRFTTTFGDIFLPLSGTGTSPAQSVTWSPTTAVSTTTTSPSVLATNTAGDGGAITYAVTSAGTTGCTVDASTAALTFAAPGSCTIAATAAATVDYTAATTSVTFVVALASQTITVVPATTTPALYSTVSLSTSGSSGTGTKSYAVTSGGGNCSIVGSTLTATAVGDCQVTATIAADTIYGSATSSAVQLSVSKVAQTVTWSPTNTTANANESPLLPDQVATSNGTGAITYSVVPADTTSDCAVDSTSGVITFGTAGSCKVRATAAATAAYAAGSVDRSFTISAVVPSKPTITTVSAGDQRVTVSYTNATYNGGAAIDYYRATATPVGGGPAITDQCASSPCDVGGLTNGQAYVVTLAAHNSAGYGPETADSPQVTPVAPTGSVTGLYAVRGDTELVISWTAPACLTGGGCGSLVGYDVYTKLSTDPTFPGAPDATVMTTTSTVTGLTNGSAYDVKVTVRTDVPSSADAFATQVPATVPATATNVTITKTAATSVLIGWDGPATDGGYPVTETAVRAVSSDGGALITKTDCTSNPCLLTGLTTGKAYNGRVTSENLIGVSAPGDSSGSVTTGLESQSISLNSPPSTMTYGQSLVLSAAVSQPSGSGARTFTVVSGPCTVSGATLTATGVGDCIVTADIAGDSLYAAAVSSQATISVSAATQSVSWSPSTNLQITSTPATLATATSSSGLGITYSVATSGSASCSIADPAQPVVVFSNPGTCVVSAAAASSANYQSASSSVTLTVTLAARSIYWTPTTMLTRDDAGVPPTAATLSVGTGSIVYSVQSASATGCSVNSSNGALTWTAPGTCAVAASNGGDSTYAAAVTVVSFNLVNASQPVTVTADSVSRTYGASGTVSVSYTATGFTDPDTFTTTPTCSVYAQSDGGFTTPLTIDSSTGVGVFVSHCSGAVAPSGYPITYVDGTVTVAKAPLTVTPDSKAVTYGDGAPTYTSVVTGFVNSDTAGNAAGYVAPTCTSAYTTTTSVSASPVTISCGSASADNYSFNYAATAPLTISKAHLTVSPSANTVSYGGAAPPITPQVTGFVNGQNSGTAAGYAAPTCSAPSYTTTTSVTASPVQTICTGGSATDYDFDVTATGSLAITQAVLTVAPDAKARTYGDAAPTYTSVVTGFVNGETAGTAAGYAAPTCTSAYTSTTSVSSSPVTIGCSGGSATNYSLDTSPTAQVTIAKAPLTVTPDSKAVVYGDSAPTYTASVTGFLNGQDAGTAVGYTAPTCGSSYSPTTSVGLTAISCSGGTATDYSFSPNVPANVTVAKKTLFVTPDAQSVSQGSKAPTYTWTASGFVNGETTASAAGLSSPSCTSPYTTKTPMSSTPLTISCTGGTADNYDLDTTATASLVVGPPVAQVPLDGCVTAPQRLPRRGKTILMLPNCVTNMGKSVSVKASLAGVSSRGDITYFRVYRTAKGYTYIQTYGKKIKVKITWKSKQAGSVKGYTLVATLRTT